MPTTMLLGFQRQHRANLGPIHAALIDVARRRLDIQGFVPRPHGD